MSKGIARTLNFGINAKHESISNVDLAQILPPNKILVGVGVLGCLGYKTFFDWNCYWSYGKMTWIRCIICSKIKNVGKLLAL